MIVRNMKWRVIFAFVALFLLGNGCAKRDEHGAMPSEISWRLDLDTAIAEAKEQNRPMMIDFMATWCPPCKAMEDSTFSNATVIAKSMSFIPLRIDVDKQGEIANKYNGNASKYGGIGIPNVLFMTWDEKKLKHIVGFRSAENFIAVMDSVLMLLE